MWRTSEVRDIMMPDGSTTVNVMSQQHPAPTAVTVALPARSPARKVTLAPLEGLTVPAPLTDHVAGAGSTVSVTSSPTPTVVRVRSGGTEAVVSEVIVHWVQDVDALSVSVEGFEPLSGSLESPLQPDMGLAFAPVF
ncbi:MAG: hypothetical protein ABSH05_17825 [Bryobacteraceae bacterium]|jgi:hypothetical protein